MLHLYDYIKFGSFFALMARNFRIAKKQKQTPFRNCVAPVFRSFCLGSTSLWESYSCWPPLISPAGSVRVSFWQGPNTLGNIMKLRNTPADKDNLTRLKLPPWTYMNMTIFHYNIWDWLFQIGKKFVGIIKSDYTLYIWKIKH